MTGRTAFRGRIVHCLRDPGPESRHDALEYFDDGVLLVDDGHVSAVGPARTMLQNLSEDYQLIDCNPCWILPGFIDCHVHYPQFDIIGSYGEGLLDWLEKYAYPAEIGFADAGHAEATAARFLDRMLACGTTSAMVFATVHPVSVEAIFKAAEARNLRLWSGKVLMDRHCPTPLQDTPASGYADSRKAIERWHGKDRLQYAITPRFAPACSDEQLELAGKLAAEHPDVYVHSHLAESLDEVRWVADLFPDCADYTTVYERFGLLRERSIFAHCLQMSQPEVEKLATSGAAMAFCPSSNLFLGSGLFDLARATAANVRVGLGSDVGGGTGLDMLDTIDNAYKVLQLNGQSLSPSRALYLATLGAARALYADDKLGNFQPGKEADFVVLDATRDPQLARRQAKSRSVTEALFAMMITGDDRLVRQTYIMGRPALPERSAK